RQDGSNTRADAELVNRELAKSLKRDISPYSDDPSENIDGQVNLGNRFYFDNGMEFGFLSGLSYEDVFDTTVTTEREFANPEEYVGERTRSNREVNLTGNLGLGFRLNSEQEINTTSLFLRDTDDSVSLRDYHNANRPLSSGQGTRSFDIRYEEREMLVNQLKGRHVWGEETRDLLGLEWLGEKLRFLDQLKLDWYYSDAEVTSEVPSEINVEAITQTDPAGNVLVSNVQLGSSMADYRFTDLEDEVLSNGWSVSLPVFLGEFDIELTGGYDYVRKTRIYKQLDFQLGTTNSGAAVLAGQALDPLSRDAKLANPDYG